MAWPHLWPVERVPADYSHTLKRLIDLSLSSLALLSLVLTEGPSRAAAEEE